MCHVLCVLCACARMRACLQAEALGRELGALGAARQAAADEYSRVAQRNAADISAWKVRCGAPAALPDPDPA